MSQEPEFFGRLLGVFAILANQRGSLLTKIRLVKFLYLLDLYSAQIEKRTRTNWPWAFVHYGPYCRESTDAIDLAVKNGYLSAQAFESNFSNEDYRLYGPGNRISDTDVDKVMDAMPIHVSTRLKIAVKLWHDDTYGLLDFVYFRTGPMKYARPGEELSFANEQMPDMESLRPVEMLPLSKKKKLSLRETIQNIGKENTVTNQPPELFDEEYFNFVSKLAGSETETGIDGTAKLSFKQSSDD